MTWFKLDFNFSKLVENIKDPGVSRTVLCVGTVIAALWSVGFFSASGWFYHDFVRTKIVAIVVLSATYIFVAVAKTGLKENGKAKLGYANYLFAPIALFLFFSSVYDLGSGNALASSKTFTERHKTSVYHSADEIPDGIAQTIRDHVKEEYLQSDANGSGIKGFEETTTVQILLEDNDAVNSNLLPPEELRKRILGLDKLQMIEATQVFSMNDRLFGFSNDVNISKDISFTNRNKIVRKKAKEKFWLWRFFDTIADGFIEIVNAGKSIFIKNKKNKPSIENIALSQVKKNASNVQLNYLDKFVSTKNVKFSKPDKIRFNSLMLLNSSLNNYVGGFTFFNEKLDSILLRTNYFHHLIWKKDQADDGNKKKYYSDLESLRNIAFPHAISGELKPLADSKPEGVDLQVFGDAPTPFVEEDVVWQEERNPMAETSDLSATIKSLNSTQNKLKDSEVTDQGTEISKNKDKHVKTEIAENVKPINSSIIDEELFEVTKAVSSMKEVKLDDNNTNTNDFSAGTNAESNSIGDARNVSPLDFLINKEEFKNGEHRKHYLKNLEAILKKKWYRNGTKEYIFFTGEKEGTAEVYLIEKLGMLAPKLYKFRLVNSTISTPYIELTQHPSTLDYKHQVPEIIKISILEYPDSQVAGSKIFLKFWSATKDTYFEWDNFYPAEIKQ